MATQTGNTAKLAGCQAEANLHDGGTLEIYTDPTPTDPDSPTTGTLIGSFTFGTPAFGSAVIVGQDAVATANPLAAISAVAGGTVTHYRTYTSAGVDPANVISQGTVTAQGGGGGLEMSNTTPSPGEPLSITSYTYTRLQE